MKRWYTYGAFGDTVIELSLLDIMKLLLGYQLRSCGEVICFGKSKLKSLGKATSREKQLCNNS